MNDNYVINYFDICNLFKLGYWIVFVKIIVNNILLNIEFIRIVWNSGICRGTYIRKYELLFILVCWRIKYRI